MEKLTRKALQYIFNDVHSSYRAPLQKGNTDTLYLPRIKRMIEFIYKIVHGMVPEYLDDFIHLLESSYDFRDD